MGSGASTNIFDFQYQKERAELRKALILSFINNPENDNILAKISAVRSIIIQHPELCATAAKESIKKFDYSPTTEDAAYHELDRLYTIYETSTILRSVQCRIGPVACPLGHYAQYFEEQKFNHQKSKSNKKKVNNDKKICNVCDKTVESGYNCSYCEYNLCIPCSKVYCCNGHLMTLWTHPESQHYCSVCQNQPITSGYRCNICEDYDICDMCTAKPGRRAIMEIILGRVGVDLKYLDDHQDESETAYRTITTHKKKMATNSYPTVLALYEFSQSLHDIQIIAAEEVRQTRIRKEIIWLRELLTVGKEFSATAYKESLILENFNEPELLRLRALREYSDKEKSVVVRGRTIVACPLGHAANHFISRPAQYKLQDLEKAKRGELDTSIKHAICKICDRNCEEGYHCDFCEYDLCIACAVIYCSKGHACVMWVTPDAYDQQCKICKKNNITSGYHCHYCSENICDYCTLKEGRSSIRNYWEKEMNSLLDFMRENKKLSDQALYYHWRHKNYIVSIGLLVDYVEELRLAKSRTENQIKQKIIIDQIKQVRESISVHPELSATAARELCRRKDYIFPNKKKAQRELDRLLAVKESMILAKAPLIRSKCGIACPLAHGMIPIDSLFQLSPNPDELKSKLIDEGASSLQPYLYTDDNDSSTTDIKSDIVHINVHNALHYSDEYMLREEEKLAYDQYNHQQSYLHMCKICGIDVMKEGGNSCPICEYDLCNNCSLVYCRLGHKTKIWTLPEAHNLNCDMCKTDSIKSGYRCIECNVDICDLCTAKDARNAFLLWPRKEVKKILDHLHSIRDFSDVAKEYLLEHDQQSEHHYLNSMSLLCRKLKELEKIKELSGIELQDKKFKHSSIMYGNYAKDR